MWVWRCVVWVWRNVVWAVEVRDVGGGYFRLNGTDEETCEKRKVFKDDATELTRCSWQTLFSVTELLIQRAKARIGLTLIV